MGTPMILPAWVLSLLVGIAIGIHVGRVLMHSEMMKLKRRIEELEGGT